MLGIFSRPKIDNLFAAMNDAGQFCGLFPPCRKSCRMGDGGSVGSRKGILSQKLPFGRERKQQMNLRDFLTLKLHKPPRTHTSKCQGQMLVSWCAQTLCVLATSFERKWHLPEAISCKIQISFVFLFWCTNNTNKFCQCGVSLIPADSIISLTPG